MSSLRRTVVIADVASRRWSLARPRLWDRLLVRWRASTLDARLAAGHPAETGRPTAMRANLLVEPATRDDLADCWQRLLARAEQARSAIGSRIPLQRSRVLAADADIRRMIVALRASAPVPARGVAIARVLISDGTGPLYNARSGLDLRGAVRDAIRHLNPVRLEVDN